MPVMACALAFAFGVAITIAAYRCVAAVRRARDEQRFVRGGRS